MTESVWADFSYLNISVIDVQVQTKSYTWSIISTSWFIPLVYIMLFTCFLTNSVVHTTFAPTSETSGPPF
jgi:hypothetical protein